MEKKMECFRQIIHFFYWFLIVFLHQKWIINNDSFLFLIIIWIIFILIIKIKPKVFFIWDLMKFFERKNDYKKFPWKWLFFFTIWAFFSLYFFEENIAYASILMLWIWDSLSNIIWRNFWKHKWKFNKSKTIEWSFWWLIWIIISSLFFVKIIPAIIASIIAMAVEALDFKIFWKRIDDNFSIPIISWFILNLFY